MAMFEDALSRVDTVQKCECLLPSFRKERLNCWEPFRTENQPFSAENCWVQQHMYRAKDSRWDN